MIKHNGQIVKYKFHDLCHFAKKGMFLILVSHINICFFVNGGNMTKTIGKPFFTFTITLTINLNICTS